MSLALAALLWTATSARPEQSSATTGPATLPTAQALLDRYIDATGGAAAYASIRSRRTTGAFAMADLGIEGRFTTLIRADGRAVSTIELPGHGTRRRGVVDGVVWEIDFAGKPQVFSGEAAQSIARSMTLAPAIALEPYASAVVPDIVELNGRPTYRMLLTTPGGAQEMRFYDVESSLLVKTVLRITAPGGEPLVVTTNHGDYEDVPPIRMSLKTQQLMAGMSPEAASSRVEHDVDLPDELFALPPEVAALLPADRPATRPASPP